MFFNKYLITLFTVFFAVGGLYCAAYNILVWQGLNIQTMPFETLYNYQIKKAQKSSAVTVFIGDSSLGNALNAGLLSELSGENTENYALTGTFGYRGSFEMLKNIYRYNKKIKHVIIMHTVDMMTRPIAENYNQPFIILKSEGFNGINLSVFNLHTVKKFYNSLKNNNWGEPEDNITIDNDYMPQGLPLSFKDDTEGFKANQIRLEKIKYLGEIYHFCNNNNLTCAYIHGPIEENICKDSNKYLSKVNSLINKSGIILLSDMPICIPREHVGDSIDHIHPDYKDQYTRMYFYNHFKNWIFGGIEE